MDDQYAQYVNAIRMAYKATGVLETYPEPVFREQTIPGADGSELYTFFYFPAEEGVFPVVVQRHPYAHLGMDFINKLTGEEYAKRGYIYVCQHCRGTGQSKGQWEPNVNERADGIALLEWVCAQSWCKNAGVLGESYLSLVGWAVADKVPDKVKTMYLVNYGVDRFTSLFKDGMMRHDVMTNWAMQNAGFKIDADYMDSCRFRPHIEVDEKLWGKEIPWYREYLRSGSRSAPLWTQGTWKEFADIPESIKIPLFVGDGWYDHHLGSAIYSFEHLSDESRAHSTLRIGGLNHFGEPSIQGREIKNIMINGAKEQLDWFEAILKREELPAPSVRTYLVNRDAWKEWPGWPMTAESAITLGFSAKEDGAAYTLCEAADKGGVSFVYDPEDPVLSHGAESMLGTKEAIGSLLQPEPGWRDDVVSFVSAPLDKEAEIAGRIKVRLYVSTDGEDTAFTAKVMEVMPDGKAYNIRSTIATISAQHGKYAPGSVVPLELEMWDVNWMLGAGSRIRVDISSSDFPQYSIHSNFAGPWYEQSASRKAEQHIWCGGDTPSAITLPIHEE